MRVECIDACALHPTPRQQESASGVFISMIDGDLAAFSAFNNN